ncbi:MAG TPA: sulfotransferase domain-containing protein [Pyrinomonadaceae bacterium]|nr:sulfotransferase domain-containing protein [Pyrinomonadaceae bacterium]
MLSTAQTISIAEQSSNLYSIVQQEVGLGAQALGRGDADMAATLFRSALAKLTADQPFYDHLVHNLLLSYKLMIEQLFTAGEDAAAFDFLRSALKLEIVGEMANDTLFRKKFAGVYQDLGLVFFKRRHIPESILCFRKSIALHESPGFHINLANALGAGGQRAELSDFTTDITPQQLGRHIFIACVPKSASTFLKDLLVSLTGYRDAFLVYAAGQNEHEIYLPTLKEVAHLDTVTQQHCRASDANVQLMQAFGIRPIVLVRNIFDSVMSLKDFYDKGAYLNTYFRADYKSLDDGAKIDLIIDNVIPWYFQFVASWTEVEKRKSLDICWLGYEELTSDKPSSIKRVLEFYGLGASLRSVEQRIKDTESGAGKIRFNKGVAGRGKSGLSEAQKERIRRLARFYPSTDFGRIGL